MAVYAGRYSEDLQDRYGNGYRNAKVAVETIAGDPVTLYADRIKTAYVPASGLEANEIKADSRGNLIFFADPGNYQIVVTPVGGSTLAAFPVSVLPDPLEPDASEGALAAEEAARIAGDAEKLDKADNLSDLASASTARDNLGLGDAATQDAADLPVSDDQAAALARKARLATVDDLSFPTFSAHRGGADLWPENTMEAFRAAFAEGVPTLELDTHLLGDRTLGVIHDATVDRTTTGTGNVTAQSRRSFKSLVIDAGSWFGGGWGNLTPSTFDEVLDELGGKAILVPEVKTTAAGPLMLEQIVQRGLERSVIVTSGTYAHLGQFAAAGIPTALVNNTGVSVATLVAAGVEWILMDGSTDATLTYIQDALAAGLKVGVYTIQNRYLAALWIGRGVHMIMSDNPVYVNPATTAYRRTTDPFTLQTWYHGMSLYTPRGSFTAPKWHTTQSLDLRYHLAGFLCPVPDPNNFTLSFTARLDVSSTTTDWVAVSICAEDDRQSGAQANFRNNAYGLLYRREGKMQIYRETRPSSATLLAENVAAPTYAIGDELALQAIVTPTSVTFKRADNAAEVTVADTTRRGPYLFYGRGSSAGVRAAFADMVLT